MTSGEDSAQVSALAATSRRRLLEVLRSSSEARDAEQLAAAVDLHVTTTRHHLGALERAGLVSRTVERAGRPGRPRVRYSAAHDSSAADGHRVLAQVLAAEFEQEADSGRRRAELAGRRWAALHVDAGPGRSPAEALASVAALFEQLGFAPRHVDDAQPRHRLALDACPFRDVARSHPEVVCTVHLGLLRGALDRLCGGQVDAQLRPFVEPELCIADIAFAPVDAPPPADAPAPLP